MKNIAQNDFLSKSNKLTIHIFTFKFKNKKYYPTVSYNLNH